MGYMVRRKFKDSDGAVLAVNLFKDQGKVILDTSPNTPGIESMVELSDKQLQELISFLSDALK